MSWCKSNFVCGDVIMLVPEWALEIIVNNRELKVLKTWQVTLTKDKLFVWPDGRIHVTGWGCHIVKAKLQSEC